MILGLPWTSWLLLIVGVGSGFGITLAFFLAHRNETGESRPGDSSSNPIKGGG